MQNLFPISSDKNLLPRDGEVYLYETCFDTEESNDLLDRLSREINWHHDEITIFGKKYITARKVAWYAENEIPYQYSGQIKTPFPYTPTLIKIKNQVEKITGNTYNACLLNFYHSGNEGMGWHSDNERSIVPQSSIASLSLGAQRRFDFKHRLTQEKISLILNAGSLVNMRGTTQEFWLHALPKSKKIVEPRINLTFRRMVE